MKKYLILLATVLLLSGIVCRQAFCQYVESHGMCLDEELPERGDFNDAHPPERRVFNPGEYACAWAVIADTNDLYKDAKWRWKQPDGSSQNGTFNHRATLDTENDKTLVSCAIKKYGSGDNEIGLPDVPGEWSVEFHDYVGFIYEETFTVLGDDDDTGDDDDYDSSPCPIAYVLGNNTSHIEIIQKFRDEILVKSKVGQKIIEVYYKNDSMIKDVLEKSPATKKIAKDALLSLIPVFELLLK